VRPRTGGPARTLAGALTLVAAVSLAGCSGDDDAAKKKGDDTSSTTSTAEFCEAYTSVFQRFSSGEQPRGQEAVDAIRAWGDALRSTGTPQDMPADAHEGYELIVSTLAKIDENTTEKDVQRLTRSFTTAQNESSTAFGDWATDACPLSTPSGAPTSSSPR
jgi:hypothetical protein